MGDGDGPAVQPDEIMVAIGTGIGLGRSGRGEEARALFDELWGRLGPDGDPLHRCALAHSMADVQADPAAELWWDLRALEAAEGISDARMQQAGMAGTAAGMLPSLHLNLADVYRRLGETARARTHVSSGLAVADALDDDEYGAMIRGGLDRLAEQLS